MLVDESGPAPAQLLNSRVDDRHEPESLAPLVSLGRVGRLFGELIDNGLCQGLVL
jgi:hypothetical protein